MTYIMPEIAVATRRDIVGILDLVDRAAHRMNVSLPSWSVAPMGARVRYFRGRVRGDAHRPKLLTQDEAWRIAANVGEVPELLAAAKIALQHSKIINPQAAPR
jgi:hypothetical protein